MDPGDDDDLPEPEIETIRNRYSAPPERRRSVFKRMVGSLVSDSVVVAVLSLVGLLQFLMHPRRTARMLRGAGWFEQGGWRN